MKTKAIFTIGLGLVFCLGLARQSPTPKDGVPGKPGGEDPPADPKPSLSFTFKDIMIHPDVHNTSSNALSINDEDVVPEHGVDVGYGNSGFISYPIIINSTDETYPESSVELIPDHAEAYWVNTHNQKAGQRYDSGIRKARLWLADNTEIDLGVAPEGRASTSCGINNAGMVVVRIWESEGVFSGLIWPIDTNLDWEVDTWFTDKDGDDINDLYFPLDYKGYAPIAINTSGQVLFDVCLLTPDYGDADGDGNPWYADEDADGANDLLVFIGSSGYTETSTQALGRNDAGTIQGTFNAPGPVRSASRVAGKQ